MRGELFCSATLFPASLNDDFRRQDTEQDARNAVRRNRYVFIECLADKLTRIEQSRLLSAACALQPRDSFF